MPISNSTNLFTLWIFDLPQAKSLTPSIFLNIVTIPLSFGWKRTILEYFHPSSHLNQYWLAFLPCLTYHEIWKVNLCPFLMLTVALVCFFLIILKTCRGGQTDTTRHYWPLVFRLQPITLCPDHTLPSELHCPSLNQQSSFQVTFIQIVCLSRALDQPLLHSAPPFTNWLLLRQS